MIEIKDVSHCYRPRDRSGEHWVLRDVSLDIAPGTFVCFLGPSGCGKTTLLRIANGLVRPSQGTIVIDGKRVEGPSADRAMVFQEFNLLPWRTARHNVEMPLEVLGFDARRRAEISAEALAQVGLAKYGQFYPHQLSGGMKQRVGLARALAIDPTYLFMDEPFGALDPQIREMMQIELMKIWDQAHVPAKAGPGLDPGWGPVRRQEHAQGEVRKTVLFVTHSVDEAVFLSDRIVMFGGQPGRIIADIAIDLPRPRWRDEEALKRSAQFVDYRHAIWHMLKQQLGTMAEPIAVTGNGD
ncbi:MAG TPA: ABC transporter ATP-binding protein [Xanthobacteraceae bacterium]|jgi:NitT/TauT family transport system ATP-binding protein|nr:ABC transporter ATP-binding protein [Xanthobacteraceae bacterium]